MINVKGRTFISIAILTIYAIYFSISLSPIGNYAWAFLPPAMVLMAHAYSEALGLINVGEQWRSYLFAGISTLPFILSGIGLGHWLFMPFTLVLMIMATYGVSRDVEHRRRISFTKLCLVLAIFWNSLLFMSTRANYLFLTISLLTMANDSMAYLFGRRFGRVKLCQSSPNKTLEGLLMATFGLVVLSSVISVLMARFGLEFPLGKKKISPYFLILFSMVVSIFANYGDLFFSRQKRIFGVKDYGIVLGEMGGLLDRFDSHAFSLMPFALVALLV